MTMTHREFIAAIAENMGSDFNTRELPTITKDGKPTTAWGVTIERASDGETLNAAIYPPVLPGEVQNLCNSFRLKFGILNGHNS